MTRRDKIIFLTTNSAVWNGKRKVLAAFDDETLTGLVEDLNTALEHQTVLNQVKETLGTPDIALNAMPEALQKAIDKKKKKSKTTVEDDSEPDGDEPAANCSGDHKPAGKGTKQMNVNEWLNDAPEEVKVVVNRSLKIVEREKKDLIEKLTVNLSGDAKKNMSQRLAGKSIGDLEEMAELLPKGGDTTFNRMTSYFAGANGTPTANAQNDFDPEDVLVMPAIDWKKN